MPNISASDYTTFLKFKAAAASPIRPGIQTRDNVTLSQSVLNANILASQAAFVTTPPTTIINRAVVTDALTNIITSLSDPGSAGLRYNTSQPHGLSVGDTVTITGMTQNTLNVDPNRTGQIVSRSDNSFVLVVGTAVTGLGSNGTGSITGRVYYTTSADHGMTTTDVATVTGVTTFSASGATVLSVPSSTTFVLQSATTGTAVTGQSGLLTYPRSFNQFVTIRNNVRVQAQPPNNVNNPNALSTLSWTSGTSGSVGSTTSSKFQQPGGLPANNVVGTYTRLPQNAGWIQGNMVSSGPKRF